MNNAKVLPDGVNRAGRVRGGGVSGRGRLAQGRLLAGGGGTYNSGYVVTKGADMTQLLGWAAGTFLGCVVGTILVRLFFAILTHREEARSRRFWEVMQQIANENAQTKIKAIDEAMGKPKEK